MINAEKQTVVTLTMSEHEAWLLRVNLRHLKLIDDGGLDGEELHILDRIIEVLDDE